MLRNFIIQAIIVFVVFQSVSFLRETTMLSADTKILATNNLLFTDVPTILDETVSLNSQGHKTVIYFFAPWCKVCHVSINNLQALYEQNSQIDVIAVALDYTHLEDVINFSQQHQLTFPIALGNEEIKNAFLITAYPSYYVISEENTVIGKSLGYSSELGLYLRSL
jgi:thiol-disulfide isomerase/thioredoxin